MVLTLLYIVASCVFGPAIFWCGLLFFAHGVGDYCDAVHGDTASREAEFRSVQIFQVTGSVVMLAIGVALLADLWVRHRRIGLLRRSASSCGIVAMMCGYVLVILISGPGGQNCSPPPSSLGNTSIVGVPGESATAPA